MLKTENIMNRTHCKWKTFCYYLIGWYVVILFRWENGWISSIARTQLILWVSKVRTTHLPIWFHFDGPQTIKWRLRLSDLFNKRIIYVCSRYFPSNLIVWSESTFLNFLYIIGEVRNGHSIKLMLTFLYVIVFKINLILLQSSQNRNVFTCFFRTFNKFENALETFIFNIIIWMKA